MKKIDFHKEAQDSEKTICYCFGYRAKDIVNDVIKNEGRSTILERILDAKKEGNCRCARVHPEKK